MKDNRSLLLLFLCTALVLTWVYHLYDKSHYSNRTREVYIKDSIAVAEAVSDSLKKIFTKTLDELSIEKLNIDSANTTLKGELDVRISEINTLKSNIGLILKRKNLTQADLSEAREKISNLQDKIESIRNENLSLADERKRLSGILAQLNLEMNSLQQTMQKVNAENTELARKINEASTFVASEIKFSAVNLRLDQKEIDTRQVKKADKFVASFVVQNYIADFQNAEVVIIITGPDGKTLNTEVWDAGSFETKTEGRKNFTRKMKFEYTKGEAKRLLFTIQPDVFQKGAYTFSLYHNGIKIGETNWKLS
jgi:predicted nuclease with TOPRIM domain